MTSPLTSTPLAPRVTRVKTPGFPAGIRVVPVVRADLDGARRIRSLMADDMRERVAATGALDHDDLVLIGWTAAQITEHFTAARALARRRAGSDA